MDLDSEGQIDNNVDPDDNLDTSEMELDYMITGTNDQVKLPMIITIQEPSLGEPKLMRKRKTPAVLRYHKANKDNQYERWMLKELMLYTPFRAKDIESYEARTAEIYDEKQNWIQIVKNKVMEHLESAEEARYMVEQSSKVVELKDIGVEINSAHEQDQADCIIDGIIEHPDYLYLDTDGIAQNVRYNNRIFK